MKKLKNILWYVFAAAMVILAVVLLLNDDLEHIEDTNGPDDMSLTTITDDNIISMDMGAMGPGKYTSTFTGDSIEFSSKKFTGVYEILYNNYWAPSDFYLNLTNFTVDSGNFKMVVVHDDAIVATLEPGMFVEYLLEDVTGTVSLRIAGESASYSFYMSQWDYDQFAHD